MPEDVKRQSLFNFSQMSGEKKGNQSTSRSSLAKMAKEREIMNKTQILMQGTSLSHDDDTKVPKTEKKNPFRHTS